MKTLPPRPTRTTVKAPSIDSLTNRSKPTKPFVPTAPASSIPPRPVMPPRLIAASTVKHKDGTESVQEKEIQIVEQDARIINHLIEYGVATRKTLAYLCGADEQSAPAKQEYLRKRLSLLIMAGVLEPVGQAQGSGMIYRVTDLGRVYGTGSYLGDQFIPKADESTLLNISSVISRISSPRPDSFFFNVASGELSVGVPVISASRIKQSTEQMAGRAGGASTLKMQQADVALWLKSAAYPSVHTEWSMDELTASGAKAIGDFFQNGFQRPLDSTTVLPEYFFQVFTEYGVAQNCIDFVIPMPHIDYGGRKYLNAMACLVMVTRESDNSIQQRLATIANNQIPFGKIAVFIPDAQAGTAKSIRENWSLLCTRKFVDPSRIDDLVVFPYQPVNAPREAMDFATPDSAGKGVKHFGMG